MLYNRFMQKDFKKKFTYIYNSFLFLYISLGFYFSTKTGISTDEFIDQYNWKLSFEVINEFLFNRGDSNFDLVNYEWRFHGVGFHYASQVYLYILNLFLNFEPFDEESSKILLNHSFIFLTFFLSGIFAKKIIDLSIKDNFTSQIFIIFYLMYPYLLGHGFYNPKDVPFLFAWLLSTYISLNIFIKILKNQVVLFSSIFLISLSTAFLLSIRISGILIFFQYFITLIITITAGKIPIVKIGKLYSFKIFLFILFTFVLTFLFYPIFWIDPFNILHSINQMREIPYGVCTLTLGNCMDALNLPSSYILIWLFFKLPVLALVGLLLFPFVEKKIFSNPERQVTLGSLILSSIIIVFLLIFFNVNLYDELRHILFLIPLIIIISFSTIYFFSKKLLLFIAFLSIFSFGIQNINMYPYQYTWFNLSSNFININNNFELDYWGVSGRNIAEKINNNDQLLYYKDKCIYVAPKHIMEPFISADYNCVKSFTSIYPKSTEKYILVKYTRNIRRENPDNCEFIFEESYNLNLFNNRLKLGEVYLCN